MNYKSTPNDPKKNEELKIEKEKYSSQKQEAKILSEIKKPSNTQSKNLLSLGKNDSGKEKSHKIQSEEAKGVVKNNSIELTKKKDSNIDREKENHLILNYEPNDLNKGKLEIPFTNGSNMNKPILQDQDSEIVSEMQKQMSIFQICDEKGEIMILDKEKASKSDEINMLNLKISNLKYISESGDYSHIMNIETYNFGLEGTKIFSNKSKIKDENRASDDNKLLLHKEKTKAKQIIINGIYLRSDMRKKKYIAFIEFINEKLDEIKELLQWNRDKSKKNTKLSISENINRTGTINTRNQDVISGLSIINDAEEDSKKFKIDTSKTQIADNEKTTSVNKVSSLNKETLYDYDYNEMQEHANINIPNPDAECKTDNPVINELHKSKSKRKVKVKDYNNFDKLSSFLDIHNQTIISEYCKANNIIDDNKILQRLDLDLQSNYSIGLKRLSSSFKMDASFNEVKLNLPSEDKESSSSKIENFMNIIQNNAGLNQNQDSTNKTIKQEENDFEQIISNNKNIQKDLKKANQSDLTLAENLDITKENDIMNEGEKINKEIIT